MVNLPDLNKCIYAINSTITDQSLVTELSLLRQLDLCRANINDKFGIKKKHTHDNAKQAVDDDEIILLGCIQRRRKMTEEFFLLLGYADYYNDLWV